MMRMVWILTITSVVAGCSSAPVVRMPDVVRVPGVVGCLGNVPERPINTLQSRCLAGEAEAAKSALVDAATREVYSLQLKWRKPAA